MKTHGMRKTKEYNAWQHMIQRCFNPKSQYYYRYGGRGVTVCERWLKFENFISDVGVSPSPKHTLDRYPNNDGNYEPGNVRWATTKEQNNNKHKPVLIDGLSRQELSKIIGGNRTLVAKRLRLGWSIEDAISVPVNANMRRNKRTLVLH